MKISIPVDIWELNLPGGVKFIYFIYLFFYCSGFCHTLKWISHGFTCVEVSSLNVRIVFLFFSHVPCLTNWSFLLKKIYHQPYNPSIIPVLPPQIIHWKGERENVLEASEFSYNTEEKKNSFSVALTSESDLISFAWHGHRSTR